MHGELSICEPGAAPAFNHFHSNGQKLVWLSPGGILKHVTPVTVLEKIVFMSKLCLPLTFILTVTDCRSGKQEQEVMLSGVCLSLESASSRLYSPRVRTLLRAVTVP